MHLSNLSLYTIHVAETIVSCFKNGGKLLICGNGGSAGQAQHFAGELVGKYLHDRRALPAIALTTDTSIITALANDFGADYIFSRQVEALGRKEDLLITLSTSGKSDNVARAHLAAASNGMDVVDLRRIGSNTPDIQENHLRIIHKICKSVEEAFLEDSN